jgi:transcriptional regulator with XRE-family HTH domain
MSNLRRALTRKDDGKLDYSKIRVTEGRTLSGEEIAKKLGMTRQAVSNTLKRGMKDFYLTLKKLEKDKGPYELAVLQMMMFQVDDQDITNFFKLYPPEIRKEIENDAKNMLRKGAPIHTKEDDTDIEPDEIF